MMMTARKAAREVALAQKRSVAGEVARRPSLKAEGMVAQKKMATRAYRYAFFWSLTPGERLVMDDER
jgi:hypothetical protein